MCIYEQILSYDVPCKTCVCVRVCVRVCDGEGVRVGVCVRELGCVCTCELRE